MFLLQKEARDEVNEYKQLLAIMRSKKEQQNDSQGWEESLIIKDTKIPEWMLL